jgi:glycosyltransferase involved in cell wall biosynthesis
MTRHAPESSASPDSPLLARPTNVCFVAGNLGRGGAERQLVHMVGCLRNTPVGTRVLCLTQGDALQAELEALGASVVWVGSQASRLARQREIMSVLKLDPPDIIQSAHFYTNMYVGMAAKALGRPSLGAIRNDVAIELTESRPFGRAHLLMPRYMIANSRLGRERAIHAGRTPASVFLVRNAVDTHRFSAVARSALASKSETLRLLFVGTMEPRKRPDRFLRLVRSLRANLPGLDLEARLVGAGWDNPELHELSASLGLDSRTVLFESPSADVVPFYTWADMLVLTSDHEGTPNVILEAMASGLPVVATAAGGVPDLMAHGGGLLVRPDDEDGLFRSVMRLRSDDRLRATLIQEGLRFIGANHSLDGLRRQLLSVYGAVSSQRSA